VNWLDVVLGLIILASVATGFMRGFVRLGIGFAAVVTGFLLASWGYGMAGAWLVPYVSKKAIADLIGFLLVFIAVLIAGALIGNLFARMLKLTGLSWLDRLLGAAFGVVRGLLICVVMVLLMTAFSPNSPPRSVVESEFSPYVIGAAGVLAAATPHDLKDSFHRRYEEVKQIWSDALQKRKRIAVERY
jgi:membrane protein required for colicin V production